MTTIKFRRDTSANWTSVNPIPAQGEPCYETDTGKLKIGNGSDNYVALPYVSDGGGSSGDLPIATATTLGGIKVGNNLSITKDGTLSANGGVVIDDTTASTTTTYSSSKIEERLADKTNVDLDNLTETGEKHFLNKSQITNCLLEVPQKIKLELNDGVLTLKAGSKVIVPNGFEADGTTAKFDEVVIENDLTWSNSDNRAFVLCYDYTNNQLFGNWEENALSGNSSNVPSNFFGYYYSVDDNLLYDYRNRIRDKKSSFPICFTTSNTSKITSIDQVFNGMGYIGSTVWVDKGVKGLIPNGRNEDGSLKNIEYTTSKINVATLAYGAQNYYLALQDDGAIIFAGKTVTKYDEIKNIVVDTYVNEDRLWGFIGEFTGGANNTISKFQPKQPFQALDYNDKNTIETWESKWFASPGQSKSVSFNLAGTGMNATNAPHIFMEMIGKVVTADGGYAVGDIVYPQFANYNGQTSKKEEGQSVFFSGNTLTYAQGNAISWVGTKATGGYHGLNTANIQIKIILRRFSN